MKRVYFYVAIICETIFQKHETFCKRHKDIEMCLNGENSLELKKLHS